MRPAPWVTTFAAREALVLYNGLTGRTVRITGAAVEVWRALLRDEAPTVDDALRATLVSGEFVATADVNAWDLVRGRYPIQARWSLFHAPDDGEITLMERLAGSADPWRPRVLDPLEAFVWENCRGRVTVARLAQAAGQAFGPDAAETAVHIVLGWTDGGSQLVKLLDAPASGPQGLPPHFYSLVHDLPVGDEPGGAVDLADYHQHAITDADQQFDTRETTLSHLLREPSAVLGGRSYGAALVAHLVARGVPLDGARLLEVGGGTGWLARRVLEVQPAVDYHIVDLSPALLAAQAARLAEVGLAAKQVHGDAMALPFPDATFDVLVSNEVIADLPAVLVDPADPPALVAQLGVVPAAPRVTNVGALAFISEVFRVLRPGGVAWISEFGDLEGEPQEAKHLDHPETGIEFSVLARAATTLGFVEVEVRDVVQDLGLQPVGVLGAPPAQFEALNALLSALALPPLEKRAYTEAAFAEAVAPMDAGALFHLSFEPATERLMTFPPRRVRVLWLVR